MKSQLLSLIKNKGLVTTLALCRSYARKELHKRTLNARHNLSIHPSADVHAKASFGTSGQIVVHRDCRIREHVIISPSGGRIEIGRNSLVNVFGTLLGHGSIRLGTDVLVGPHTTIVAANHTYTDPDVPVARQDVSREGIEIHDDVWIGANCTILDGTTIGEGSVVAAGSVVTESVPPYTVVAGVPAEEVAKRE